MNARTNMWLVAAVAGLATVAAACTSDVPNRAGGTVDAKTSIVLTLAGGNIGAPEQVTDWINQVHDLSHGSISIEVKDDWRAGQPDFEAQTVQDVKQGKVDMAWVGARAMDRVGDTSFQALLAPMLVDSYDLETSVFHAGIPTQMLAAVPAAGVVGVAVLPGPMRKVLGIAKPFLTPADFAGARIAEQDSALSQLTLQTLGATAVALPRGVKLHGVDGYEQQLSSIAGNYDTIAKYTTANLNLWPRPLLIIMGKAAWAKLSGTQHDILRKAADAALQPAIDASRQEDQQALPVLCGSRMALPTARPQQLADLRAAVDPVYAALRRDASTNKWLNQIQALKEQLHAAPETVSCARSGGASQQAAPIDGTYWRQSGVADVMTACHGKPPGTGPAPAHNSLEVVFDHSHVTEYEVSDSGTRETAWRGTYQVFRDTLKLTEEGTTASFTVTWSLNGSTLTLSNLRNGYNCLEVAVWAHAWIKRT